MATTAPRTKSLQAEIREWIRGWADEQQGGVEAAGDELRQAFTDRFGEDVEFHGRIWDYVLNEVLPIEARTAFKQQRRIHAGPMHFTREELEQRTEDTRWDRWRKHREAVDGKGYVTLPEMTKEDLVVVINDRKGQVRGELIHIAFLAELAKKMRPAQTVEDRFTPKEIAAIRDRVRKTKETA